MSDELKPCPGCGWTDIARYVDRSSGIGYEVLECTDADCAWQVRVMEGGDVVAAWNRRPASPDPSDDSTRRALGAMVAAYRSMESVVRYASGVLGGTEPPGDG